MGIPIIVDNSAMLTRGYDFNAPRTIFLIVASSLGGLAGGFSVGAIGTEAICGPVGLVFRFETHVKPTKRRTVAATPTRPTESKTKPIESGPAEVVVAVPVVVIVPVVVVSTMPHEPCVGSDAAYFLTMILSM
jgi:hypothetical protein